VNQVLGANTIRFGGASTVRNAEGIPLMINRPQLPPVKEAPPVLPKPPAVLSASLPLVSSRAGNLFVDRNDSQLHWYLPDFALADDTDPAFTFAARQSGQDEDGNPYNVARLTLRLRKFQPNDVVQFAGANPGAVLQEIPLAELSAVLTSVYTDNNQDRQRTFTAAIQDAGSDFSLLMFEGILGDSVAGLYQDLRLFGKAVLRLFASYQGWSQQGTMFFAVRSEDLTIREELPGAVRTATPLAATRFRSFSPGLTTTRFNPGVPAQHPLVQTRQVWQKLLPLALKYNQDAYQLKFTVETVVPPVPNHPILNVDDLRAFALKQSEFTELKALGDISLRYPTLSRAYIGVRSRTIIVIPRRYSIVCGHAGCAALCMALVDSSAADGSKCKFEFDFTIAPEISRIEIANLVREVVNREGLQDYTVKLPDFQHDTPPSTLMTAFKSKVEFGAHSFALTVSIYDDGSKSPAVANANLFISRLCVETGADLIGSLSLKLDDGYTEPVLATIDLNFAHTALTDVIAVEINDATRQIKLTNESPLDLQLTGYALLVPVPSDPTGHNSVITEVPGALVLAAKDSLTIPLPPDHTGLTVAADAQLVIPEPMTKSNTMKFLNFQTADVQETQYVVAVSGSGVDFNRVDSILANITFSNLPKVAPRPMSLNKNLHADSTHIVIPVEDAVFSLPGTVKLTVHFVDPGVMDLEFTIDNDFTSDPVLVLLQSAIDRAAQKS
jgi:hypothetical protein